MPISDINMTSCMGCGACKNICQRKCITMEESIEGFLYPHIDEDRCVHCGLCDRVCACRKRRTGKSLVPVAYAAVNKDETIRYNSSSGGFFSVIARKILEKEGVVYGVRMSEDFMGAYFTRVVTVEELELLRGSKYIQASMNDAYKNVKDDLKSGRFVLFTGTPCQVNALKLYLGKEMTNLMCMEVICHGTPSPALWRKYIEHFQAKYSSRIMSVNFREKSTGWSKSCLQIVSKNITQRKCFDEDSYLQLFLRDLALRPSCYDCTAKKQESRADITIGDFWGIETVIPEMNDGKGVSLVLIHTEKGQQMFDAVRNNISYKRADFEAAIKRNSAYSKSVKCPPDRAHFFDDFSDTTFRELENRYIYTSMKSRIAHAVRDSYLYMRIVRKGGAK